MKLYFNLKEPLKYQSFFFKKKYFKFYIFYDLSIIIIAKRLK